MEMHERFLTPEELYVIVGTGSRPVCFSAASEDYVWGKGSSFLFNYDETVYAITAKHVVENQQANPQHLRIFMQGTNVALPIKGGFTVSFDQHDNKEEVEDFLIFEIDDQLFIQESGQDLYSWDFKRWSYPTSKVAEDTEILVAGFPFTDEIYDYDNKKINHLLLMRTGNLTNSILGKDMYTMEGLPSETPFNGLSGSPVFCRLDGFVYFIGLVTKGSSSSGKLHFIGSEVIRNAMEIKINEKHHT